MTRLQKGVLELDSLEVCHAVERIPASREATEASVKAAALRLRISAIETTHEPVETENMKKHRAEERAAMETAKVIGHITHQ